MVVINDISKCSQVYAHVCTSICVCGGRERGWGESGRRGVGEEGRGEGKEGEEERDRKGVTWRE